MLSKGAAQESLQYAEAAASKNTMMPNMSGCSVERLIFGVDSKIPATGLLQNNITEFEWVKRNNEHPMFWGRCISGENALSREEIKFLHLNGCKVAPLYFASQSKENADDGKADAESAAAAAKMLEIKQGAAIFLVIEDSDRLHIEYLKEFVKTMLDRGYIPGFKANTDAAFAFDRQFSRGMLFDRKSFEKCLVWATSPSLVKYERITDTHIIQPDIWRPFAPSSISRNDISVWQYGKNCHPILDDEGNETVFNVDLVKNIENISNTMF